MGEDNTKVEAAEPGSLITLDSFYKSTQHHLITTTKRSLDFDKKDLAGRLDDVLLRQRFWEDDIHLDDGALSDLEANDRLASSIIRRYLDDISYLLHEIDKTLVEPVEYVSFSDTNSEKDKIALLLETNTKLCTQVEIFDAIVANKTMDGAGSDRKATAIGRLRCQLEEENKMLECEAMAQAPFVPTSSGESGSSIGSIRSKMSSEKREDSPAASSAKAEAISHSSIFQDKPLAPAHTASKAVFWFCSECRNPNNEELSPEKCSICAHTRCAFCSKYFQRGHDS